MRRRRDSELQRAVDESERRIDAGIGRPMRMMLTTLSYVRNLHFRTPEAESVVAAALLSHLPDLTKTVFGESAVAKLQRTLDEFKHQVTEMARKSSAKEEQ